MKQLTQIKAAVTKATIMEERALVERSIAIDLPAGLVDIITDEVTPLIVERTLQAVALKGDFKILAVNLVREHTLEPKMPQEAAARKKECAAAQKECQHFNDQLELLSHQQGELQKLLELWQAKSNDQAMRGADLAAFWQDEYHQLLKQHQENCERQFALSLSRAEADEFYNQCQQLYRQASSGMDHYLARLHLVLEVQTAGICELSVAAIQPCIAWRPVYLAESAENQLLLQRRAMIWQNSGEDWAEARVVLSTARPGRGNSLPTLEADCLTVREKSSEERKSIKLVSTTVAAKKSLTGSDDDNISLPGVADGGQVQVFELPGKIDLPTAKGAKLVDLDLLTLPAETGLCAYPENGAYFVVRSRQKLAAACPLLGGPVLLQRGGCFVGRSMLDYVAPGQDFTLDFGSDDELQIVRTSRPVKEDKGSLKNSYNYNIEINIYNLSNKSKKVQLTERIPVSENSEVEVKLDRETSAAYQLDAEQGFLTWTLDLDPHATKDLQLAFTVETGKKVQWAR